MNNDITQNLHFLLRYIVRAFYTDFEIPIVDLLIKYKCFREDDQELENIFHIYPRYVRESLNSLAGRGFIDSEEIVEAKDIDEEGKLKGNQNMKYYFINYKYLYLSLKYHIDSLQKNTIIAENEARTASGYCYECSSCKYKYDMITAIQRMNEETNDLLCQRCVNGKLISLDITNSVESNTTITNKLLFQLSYNINNIPNNNILFILDNVNFELIPESIPSIFLKSREYLLFLQENPNIVDMGRLLYGRKTLEEYNKELLESKKSEPKAVFKRNELPEFLQNASGFENKTSNISQSTNESGNPNNIDTKQANNDDDWEDA